MEIHQIRYFQAVAQTKNFTKAADLCAVSQPSLSIQIAKLESELGGALFERTKRNSSLTARGKLFYLRAQAILQTIEEAKRESEALSQMHLGQVSLGCMPITGSHLLPPILTVFNQKFPQIKIHLKEASSPQLVQDLEQDQIELAILDDAGFRASLNFTVLLKEKILLAVSPKHPLAQKSSIHHLRQLKAEPFILMKPNHGFSQITDDLFRKSNFKPWVVFESDQIETIQSLVAVGLGLSFVPAMVQKPGLCYLDIVIPKAFRTICLSWKSQTTLSLAAQNLKKIILHFFESRSF
jgi:DNA-binding transcriptional LysR family regulator